MKVSMVRSGGVDGAWLSPSYGADLLTGEPTGDDVKGSASAVGTGSV